MCGSRAFRWCVLDHENNRVLDAGPDAWRYIYGLRQEPGKFPEALPAEAFGPLPLRFYKKSA